MKLRDGGGFLGLYFVGLLGLRDRGILLMSGILSNAGSSEIICLSSARADAAMRLSK